MDGGFPIFEKWIYYEISEYSSDINFSNIHLCFAGAYVENREAYNGVWPNGVYAARRL